MPSGLTAEDRERLIESIRTTKWEFLQAATEWASKWEGVGPWPEIYAELLDRFTDSFLYGRTLPEVKTDAALLRYLDQQVFDYADLLLGRVLRGMGRWHQTRYIAAAALRRAREIAREATSEADALVGAHEIGEAAAALGDSIFEGTDWAQAVGTGFRGLDRLLNGGLPRGELTLIGAGTGQGKSLLALIIAANVAQRHGAVVVSSPEMRRQDMGLRLCLRHARVSRMQLHEQDMQARDRYVAAIAAVKALPMHLLDKTDADVYEVVRVARRLNQDTPVQLLVLDYAQQLAPQAGGDKARYLEVAKVATEALQFAAETGAAVLVTSQLNEQRDKQGHVTGVSFRESAITEHKSAVAAILALDRDKRAGRLTLRKNRHGATASVPLSWTPEWCDLAETEEYD